jgi:hypothetical protein
VTRALKPRATANLAIAAVLVSDRTAPAVLGLEPRVFRWLLAHRHVRHEVLGRRVVARVDDVLEALGLGDVAGAELEAVENDKPSLAPRPQTGADRILARIGRVRRSA